MSWLKDNWFKVGIVIVLLVIAFGYLDYLNGKNSLALQKQQAEETEAYVREQQEKREYIADRKQDCMNVYKTEGAKWNNVVGWRYSDIEDGCYIQYKDSKKKTEEQCASQYRDKDGKIIPLFIMDYALCLDGKFENSF